MDKSENVENTKNTENVTNLRKFLVEEFYSLSLDNLKNLDKNFKEVVKQNDGTDITGIALSEDLDLIEKICKQYEKTPVGQLARLFYLLKKISTNLIWTGFNMFGKEGNEKMLLVLRPVRINMVSLTQVEQVYEMLSEDFDKSKHVVVTKYEINSNASINSKILGEGLVSVVSADENKYDLYFYNMPDKTEFDLFLNVILGVPGYMAIIRNSHYYTGNVSNFNAAIKKVIENVVQDDLLLQSNPVEVLRWFNTKMVKKDPSLGFKFCSVSGIPLSHFGNYHDGNKAKFY